MLFACDRRLIWSDGTGLIRSAIITKFCELFWSFDTGHQKAAGQTSVDLWPRVFNQHPSQQRLPRLLLKVKFWPPDVSKRGSGRTWHSLTYLWAEKTISSHSFHKPPDWKTAFSLISNVSEITSLPASILSLNVGFGVSWLLSRFLCFLIKQGSPWFY